MKMSYWCAHVCRYFHAFQERLHSQLALPKDNEVRSLEGCGAADSDILFPRIWWDGGGALEFSPSEYWISSKRSTAPACLPPSLALRTTKFWQWCYCNHKINAFPSSPSPFGGVAEWRSAHPLQHWKLHKLAWRRRRGKKRRAASKREAKETRKKFLSYLCLLLRNVLAASRKKLWRRKKEEGGPAEHIVYTTAWLWSLTLETTCVFIFFS